MLRQGIVHERVADFSASNYCDLPPLKSLPQWSRVKNLDRARYPKAVVRDYLQQAFQPTMSGGTMMPGDGMLTKEEVDAASMNPTQHIHHLEKSMAFVKQQHHDVLQSLHREIELLRKENKDMNFKMIMTQKSTPPPIREDSLADITVVTGGSGDNRLSEALRGSESDVPVAISGKAKTSDDSEKSRDQKLEELRILFLEEEVKELQHGLKESKHQNTYLNQLLEQAEDQKRRQHAAIEALHFQQYQQAHANGFTLDSIPADMNPIKVISNPNRPPTLTECEVIIRHLQQVNERQSYELVRLKSDLRDVLYSHKWTPDAYLLAKAYIAEDDTKDSTHLPKLQIRHPAARKMPDIAYIQKESVALPALKQTMGNKAAERRKRTQILQKARVKRETSVSHQ